MRLITDTVRYMKDSAVKGTQHEGEINIEEEVNRNERLSRSSNARFLGVAETRSENCLAIVEDILRLKFWNFQAKLWRPNDIGRPTGMCFCRHRGCKQQHVLVFRQHS